MINIKCQKIASEFVCAYVKDNEYSEEELQLQKRKNGYHIRNVNIVQHLVEAYDNFMRLNESISEYFGRTIIHASHHTTMMKKNESNGDQTF